MSLWRSPLERDHTTVARLRGSANHVLNAILDGTVKDDVRERVVLEARDDATTIRFDLCTAHQYMLRVRGCQAKCVPFAACESLRSDRSARERHRGKGAVTHLRSALA